MTQRAAAGRLQSGFDSEAKCLIIQTQESCCCCGSQVIPAVLSSEFWVDEFRAEFFAEDEDAIIFAVFVIEWLNPSL